MLPWLFGVDPHTFVAVAVCLIIFLGIGGLFAYAVTCNIATDPDESDYRK